MVPLFIGEHPGDRLVGSCWFEQFQRDRPVGIRVLPLLALPFFTGQTAHIVVKAAGRPVVVLHHPEIFEAAPHEHSMAVHRKVVREFGAPGKVPGYICSGGDGRDERILPELVPEQVVGRAVGIAERRGALAVMQAVTKHITERRKDVVTAFQREQEATRIEEGPGTVVPVAMVLGVPHLETLAEENYPFLFAEGNAVQVGGHNGIRPDLHLAVEALERENVGNVADVFVVPEEDLVVASDAKVIKSFHSRYRFGPKIRIFRNNSGVSQGVRVVKNTILNPA